MVYKKFFKEFGMTKKKSVLTLLMGLFLLSSSFAFAACKEDAADETDTLAL